jgi:hypothetical protein
MYVKIKLHLLQNEFLFHYGVAMDFVKMIAGPHAAKKLRFTSRTDNGNRLPH